MSYEISAIDSSGKIIKKTEPTAIGAHGWRDEYRDKRYEAVLVKKDGKIVTDDQLDDLIKKESPNANRT
jgi:hypothetical protein